MVDSCEAIVWIEARREDVPRYPPPQRLGDRGVPQNRAGPLDHVDAVLATADWRVGFVPASPTVWTFPFRESGSTCT